MVCVLLALDLEYDLMLISVLCLLVSDFFSVIIPPLTL